MAARIFAQDEFSDLLEQIKLLWTEGKTWPPDERAERRRALVDQYVRVFAPALAFSGTQLLLTFATATFIYAALAVSGRGFADFATMASDVPWVGGALDSIDPSLGNAAISLLGVELSAPILVPLAIAFTPKATDALNRKLAEWDLDAEGLNARIEDVLEKTS